MRILVACEESQVVTKEFRKLGHEAYSCDVQNCSGGHPEWHIVQDVIPLLNGNCIFRVQDATKGKITICDKWDMIIAFPPCTHLAVSGARHFEKKRLDGRQKEAIEFFCNFLKANCEKIVIENPVGIISGNYIFDYFPELSLKYNLPVKPTQIIQPYEFGDAYKKSTCLWIKGLPALIPTNIVEPEDDYVYKNGKKYPGWMMKALQECNSSEERAKIRSKTFPGIAKAMAEQWTR